MAVHDIMRAWHVSRQQTPARKQQLPQLLTRAATDQRSSLVGYRGRDGFVDNGSGHNDVFDEDASINVEKRDDIVPLRPGLVAGLTGDDGFWNSHLFWKGIVFGVIAVVLAKTVFQVQMPFGIDWYRF